MRYELEMRYELISSKSCKKIHHSIKQDLYNFLKWKNIIHVFFILFIIIFYFFIIIIFLIVVGFVIHWNESAMDLHVFPIPIPPPTSLSTRSL